MKRASIAILLLSLAMVSCSGDNVTETFSEIGSGLDGGSLAQYSEEGAPPRDAAGELVETTDKTISLDVIFSDNRKVIRQVTLTMASDRTRETYDEIIRIAESAGGFVSDAQVEPSGDGEEPFIRLTVRIPANGLTTSLTAIKNTADEVLAESQGAQDVTANFIDLEAQLTNLQALEVELRALLEEVRQQPDADPDKLLRVFTEISNTRGQIEQIQGQLNYLSDVVDLSTVSISIEPSAAAVPIVEESWAPLQSVRDALRSLVAGLQDITDNLISFTIGTLPILLIVVGLPGLIVFLIYRAWRRRHPDLGRSAVPVPAAE